MSEFFDSDIIKEELLGINRLQEQVYKNAFSFDDMDREEKLDHIENLTELLEKQRVMYTRLSLSEDSQAKKMKEDLVNSVTSLGFPIGTDVNLLFSSMENSIEMLKSHIDD